MNKQVEAMRKIGLSDAEIAELLEVDGRIDKGEKLFGLEKDQEQASKEIRSVSRKPSGYNRERKPNEDKRFLIDTISELLKSSVDNEEINILNPEREFVFTYHGIKYKITLSAPRK